jgi:hypothetical protein
MTYFSIRNGVIIRHSLEYGSEVEAPMPTITLRCEKCGWETKALNQGALPTCVCGGTLQTINATSVPKRRKKKS